MMKRKTRIAPDFVSLFRRSEGGCAVQVLFSGWRMHLEGRTFLTGADERNLGDVDDMGGMCDENTRAATLAPHLERRPDALAVGATLDAALHAARSGRLTDQRRASSAGWGV